MGVVQGMEKHNVTQACQDRGPKCLFSHCCISQTDAHTRIGYNTISPSEIEGGLLAKRCISIAFCQRRYMTLGIDINSIFAAECLTNQITFITLQIIA